MPDADDQVPDLAERAQTTRGRTTRAHTDELRQHSDELRQRADRVRQTVAATAEAIARTEDELAVTLIQLADSHPDRARHLKSLSRAARDNAAYERQWAADHSPAG